MGMPVSFAHSQNTSPAFLAPATGPVPGVPVIPRGALGLYQPLPEHHCPLQGQHLGSPREEREQGRDGAGSREGPEEPGGLGDEGHGLEEGEDSWGRGSHGGLRGAGEGRGELEGGRGGAGEPRAGPQRTAQRGGRGGRRCPPPPLGSARLRSPPLLPPPRRSPAPAPAPAAAPAPAPAPAPGPAPLASPPLASQQHGGSAAPAAAAARCRGPAGSACSPCCCWAAPRLRAQVSGAERGGAGPRPRGPAHPGAWVGTMGCGGEKQPAREGLMEPGGPTPPPRCTGSPGRAETSGVAGRERPRRDGGGSAPRGGQLPAGLRGCGAAGQRAASCRAVTTAALCCRAV